MVDDAQLELANIDPSGDPTFVVPSRDIFWIPVPNRLWFPKSSGESARPDVGTAQDLNPNAYPRIEWRIEKDADFRRAAADEPCLVPFTRLADVSGTHFEERVEEFVRQWGPLGLCYHGKPSMHDRLCLHVGTPVKYEREDIATIESLPMFYSFWEPMDAWRRYAEHFNAILTIAADLQQGLPGQSGDWDAVQAVELEPDEMPLQRLGRPQGIDDPGRLVRWQPRDSSIEAQKRAIARAVATWGEFGGLALEALWSNEHAALRPFIRYEGLAGVLAIQLAAALASPAGVYRCEGCKRGFFPEGHRRRASDRRAWCGLTSQCDEKAQKAFHARRRYHDEKQARQLRTEGVSIDLIGRRLERRPDQIRRWLKEDQNAT